MSNYRNFIEDFPKRCLKILKAWECDAPLPGHEVTLMLAMAGAGLNIPYERLRPPRRGGPDHPAGDRGRYPEAARELEALLRHPFLSSRLWQREASAWLFVPTVAPLGRGPDQWPELPGGMLPSDKNVRDVVDVLRNALAHGSIFSYGDPIERLLFLSANYTPHDGKMEWDGTFSMLSVSPRDFRDFLEKWVEFLSKLPIPSDLEPPYVLEFAVYVDQD